MVLDDSRDYTVVTDVGHGYIDTIPRTTGGGIPHWAEEFAWGNEHQMWLDSLFMWGLFLLSEHERTGEQAHLDEWVAQYLLFSDLLRDPTDQLYRHAWDDEVQAAIPTEATYWARGNSWVLVSAAEALAQLGPDHASMTEVLLSTTRRLRRERPTTRSWSTAQVAPRRSLSRRPGTPTRGSQTTKKAMAGSLRRRRPATKSTTSSAPSSAWRTAGSR